MLTYTQHIFYTQTEIPVYGSGKLGTYYPVQDGSMNYEITDHLGNVRALVRENVNIYTATMEDDGTADITNPRVEEMQYFRNLFETEKEDARFNHTPAAGAAYSAYLYWVGGSGSEHKAVGPAITLKVNAGDTIKAETWVRYENKLSYSRSMNIAALAGLLGSNFAFTQGFETYTLSQTTSTFSNALAAAGFMGDGMDDETPFAYINYILFDESMTQVDAGWRRVDESMGFDPGQEALIFHQHKRLALEEPVYVPENGYIYIWVSNESEGTRVWFDDVKVTHTQVVVTQASDYGVWGDVLRELKAPEFTYRHGYQGQYSEKDEETGWNHFELREYDAVIGRWTTMDAAKQYWSPYLGMGNDPVNGVDSDGAFKTRFGAWFYSLFNGGDVVFNGAEWHVNKLDKDFNTSTAFDWGNGNKSFGEHLWNTNIRNVVPDVITLDVSWGASFPIGASNTYTLNIITRGQDVGFYGTQTLIGGTNLDKYWRYGAEIDGGLNIGGLWYAGNPNDFRFNDLLGKTRVTSGGFGVGANYIESISPDGHVVVHGLSAGIGVTLGLSHGIGETIKLK